MLCLTRRVNEAIRIGEDVEIVITRLTRGQVQIGIIAPPGVRVLRSELDGEGRTAANKTRSDA